MEEKGGNHASLLILLFQVIVEYARNKSKTLKKISKLEERAEKALVAEKR